MLEENHRIWGAETELNVTDRRLALAYHTIVFKINRIKPHDSVSNFQKMAAGLH